MKTIIHSVKEFLDEPMPRGVGWLQSLGSVLLALVLVQLVTGVLLALYYTPSAGAAYQSIQHIDSQVVFGKFIRGLHHWSASAFVVVIALHLLVVFGYAGYKRPRQMTWILGVLLLLIVLGFGFTGYLLPWDMKAYFATRVGIEVGASVPFLGAFIKKVIQGGSTLGTHTLTRFYALHVIVLPISLILMALGHLFYVRHYRIASPSTPVGREDEIEYGRRFHPYQFGKDTVAIVLTFAVLVILAGALGAPLEGKADPTNTSYVPAPDWYFYGLYQLLRVFKGPLELFATVILPGLFFLALLALPFLDRSPHRSLRQRPLIAAAGLSTLAVILLFTVWGRLAVRAERARVGAVMGATEPTFFKEGELTDSTRIANGQALYEGLRCGGCHAGPAMAENIPPGFEFAGWKLNPEWTYRYLKRPTRLRWESMGSRPVARMPEFHLSDREARDLAIYLNTLRPVKYEAPLAWAVDRVDTTKARAGAAIVKSNFCKTCHRIGGRGGRLGPDLTGVGARLKHDYIYRFIRDPRLFVPGTPMKDFELSDEEVEAVVHYLLAQGGDGQ